MSLTKADLDETWENPSYKHPGASYTAEGRQKQPEILKHLLYLLHTHFKTFFGDLDIGFQTFGAGSKEEISPRIQI